MSGAIAMGGNSITGLAGETFTGTIATAAAFSGTYSSAAIDTTAATASIVFNAAAGQKTCLNSGTYCLSYLSSGNLLNYSTPSNANALNIDQLGDVEFAGVLRPLSSTPTVASCGTSPTITGNSTSGVVTVGTGSVTACTVNLTNGFPATPAACVISPANSTAAASGVGASTALADRTTGSWIIRGTALAGAAFNYVCM